MAVSVQFSVYPLGQSDLALAVNAAVSTLAAAGLDHRAQSMSTVFEGSAKDVFAALRDAFEAAARYGGTVMTCTISNACPRALEGEGSGRDG